MFRPAVNDAEWEWPCGADATMDDDPIAAMISADAKATAAADTTCGLSQELSCGVELTERGMEATARIDGAAWEGATPQDGVA